MRRALCILAFILAAQLNLCAQEAQPASPGKKADYLYVIGDPRHFPFDKYGEISFEEERARLDEFALELARQPGMIGYIIASHGMNDEARKIAERLKQAKNYLLLANGFEANRIVTLQGSCDDGLPKFELYIERPDAFLPNSAPTVKLEAKMKTAPKKETQTLPNRSP